MLVAFDGPGMKKPVGLTSGRLIIQLGYISEVVGTVKKIHQSPEKSLLAIFSNLGACRAKLQSG